MKVTLDGQHYETQTVNGSYLQIHNHRLYVCLQGRGLTLIPEEHVPTISVFLNFAPVMDPVDPGWKHIIEDRLGEAGIEIAGIISESLSHYHLHLQTKFAIDVVIFEEWLGVALSGANISWQNDPYKKHIYHSKELLPKIIINSKALDKLRIQE